MCQQPDILHGETLTSWWNFNAEPMRGYWSCWSACADFVIVYFLDLFTFFVGPEKYRPWTQTEPIFLYCIASLTQALFYSSPLIPFPSSSLKQKSGLNNYYVAQYLGAERILLYWSKHLIIYNYIICKYNPLIPFPSSPKQMGTIENFPLTPSLFRLEQKLSLSSSIVLHHWHKHYFIPPLSFPFLHLLSNKNQA